MKINITHSTDYIHFRTAAVGKFWTGDSFFLRAGIDRIYEVQEFGLVLGVDGGFATKVSIEIGKHVR